MDVSYVVFLLFFFILHNFLVWRNVCCDKCIMKVGTKMLIYTLGALLCFCSSSFFSQGMSIIEQLDPMSFTNYLKKYRNTICGRHPIGVLLNVGTVEEMTSQNVLVDPTPGGGGPNLVLEGCCLI